MSTCQLFSYSGQDCFNIPVIQLLWTRLSTCHVIIILLASDSFGFGLRGWTQDVMAATGNCKNGGLCIPKVKGNVNLPKKLSTCMASTHQNVVHLYGFLNILHGASRHKIYSPRLYCGVWKTRINGLADHGLQCKSALESPPLQTAFNCNLTRSSSLGRQKLVLHVALFIRRSKAEGVALAWHSLVPRPSRTLFRGGLGTRLGMAR